MNKLIAKAIAWGLSLFTGGFIDDVFGYFKERQKSEVRKLEIESAQKQNADIEQTKRVINHQDNSAKVNMKAMNFKVFWWAWGMCAIPVAAWFGWGMLDSLFNGILPDVAKLPDQLLRYADIVFANIFYSGIGLGAVQTAANIFGGRK